MADSHHRGFIREKQEERTPPRSRKHPRTNDSPSDWRVKEEKYRPKSNKMAKTEDSSHIRVRVKKEEREESRSRVIPKIEDKRDLHIEGRVKKEEREDWSKDESEKLEKKEGINLGLSGKLTEDANTYNGVVISYSQPPEARKPKRRWRWYIFKGDQEIPFLPLHRQSAYLIGRNRKVADIPIDHPSCSKQHSVLQYRLVTYIRSDGSKGRTVKPYIIDLDSANGTYVNTKRINPRQYLELFERDVVKFGFSSREYVLLHEGSKGSDNDEVDSGPELSPYSMLKS